jgi:hypothetical protein
VSGCRISKVTYKDSGLTVFTPRQRTLEQHDIDHMHEQLDNLANNFDKGLAAIIIIGLGMDMTFSRAPRWHNDMPIGPTSVPSIVADILRRDYMTDVAHDVLDERMR